MLSLPVNKAVGIGVVLCVVAVVKCPDHRTFGCAAPSHDVRRAVSLGAQLKRRLTQGVQRVKHPDLAHGGVGDIAVVCIGVVKNDKVHVGFTKQVDLKDE